MSKKYVADLVKEIGLEATLQGLVEYMKSLPDRQEYEEQVLSGLSSILRAYQSRYEQDACGECASECTCSRHTAIAHACPYQGEINNDYEFECTCCAYCEHQCAMDI